MCLPIPAHNGTCVFRFQHIGRKHCARALVTLLARHGSSHWKCLEQGFRAACFVCKPAHQMLQQPTRECGHCQCPQ
eukprot:258706-Amphidinium_carterae.1